MASINIMPLDTNFALISHPMGEKNGEKHLKVIWLFLAYLFCHTEWQTWLLGIKGLFWQGRELYNMPQRKSTGRSIPSDVWLYTWS